MKNNIIILLNSGFNIIILMVIYWNIDIIIYYNILFLLNN